MVRLLPERLAITVAPAIAANVLGGTGAQRSSQISTPTTRSGTDDGLEEEVGPERHVAPTELDRCRRSPAGPR